MDVNLLWLKAHAVKLNLGNLMNKMTPYLSDKIKVLSLVAITMVIYIHTYYTEGNGFPFFLALQRFLGGVGLSGVANPLFYFTSGYLFFLGVKSVKECFPKMKKRVRTLFVPYLLANTLAFLLYVVLDVVSRLSPSLYGVVNFHILDWFSLDVFTLLKNIYWGPVAFQLWFVRDMMLFVLLSPLIYYLLAWASRMRVSTLLLLIVLLCCYFFTCKHVLWMAIGGLISMSDVIDITIWKSSKLKDAFIIFCGLIFIAFAFCNSIGIVDLHYGYALFGVIAVWLLYDKIAKGRIFVPNNKYLATACGFTFFIYLIHEPILLIFKKLPLLVSSGELMLTICFLFMPLVFIIMTIYMGVLLRKMMPKALSLYMGGR